MSVATNPNRRQALREATQDAIAQFMQNGGNVTACGKNQRTIGVKPKYDGIATKGLRRNIIIRIGR